MSKKKPVEKFPKIKKKKKNEKINLDVDISVQKSLARMLEQQCSELGQEL
jgi:hypothetical protein